MTYPIGYLLAGAAILSVSGATAVEVALCVPLYALFEYAVHRFVLHGPWDAVTLYRIHGAHHADPADPKSVHVPIRTVVSAVVVVAVGMRGISGAVYPGLIALLIIQFGLFEAIHLGLHGHGPLAGRLPRRMVAHHAAHHNRDENASYAVSWPIVDAILRTGQGPAREFRFVSGSVHPPGRVAARTPEAAAKYAALKAGPGTTAFESVIDVDGVRFRVKTYRGETAAEPKVVR